MTDQQPKLGVNTGNRGKGRPKGSQNKATVAVKDALHAAFDKIGGAEKLAVWASDNPTEFYKLWAKMLPTDVNANLNGSVSVIQLVGVRPGDSRQA